MVPVFSLYTPHLTPNQQEMAVRSAPGTLLSCLSLSQFISSPQASSLCKRSSSVHDTCSYLPSPSVLLAMKLQNLRLNRKAHNTAAAWGLNQRRRCMASLRPPHHEGWTSFIWRHLPLSPRSETSCVEGRVWYHNHILNEFVPPPSSFFRPQLF